MGLLDGSARTAAVTASTAAEVLVLDAEGFTRLRSMSTPTEVDLLSIASQRLEDNASSVRGSLE